MLRTPGYFSSTKETYPFQELKCLLSSASSPVHHIVTKFSASYGLLRDLPFLYSTVCTKITLFLLPVYLQVLGNGLFSGASKCKGGP